MGVKTCLRALLHSEKLSFWLTGRAANRIPTSTRVDQCKQLWAGVLNSRSLSRCFQLFELGNDQFTEHAFDKLAERRFWFVFYFWYILHRRFKCRVLIEQLVPASHISNNNGYVASVLVVYGLRFMYRNSNVNLPTFIIICNLIFLCSPQNHVVRGLYYSCDWFYSVIVWLSLRWQSSGKSSGFSSLQLMLLTDSWINEVTASIYLRY